MIDMWIPSFNRACQLDLLLTSLEKNANGLFNYYINYTYSNEDYKKGYDKLIDSFVGSKCNWYNRKKYGQDFFSFLMDRKGDIFCHAVDDCIFYRPSLIIEKDVRAILDEDYGYDFWGFNWRVGLDTVIDNHRDRKPIQYPASLKYSDLVTNWKYTDDDDMWKSYWNFPYSLDGFTYRVNDILDYLNHVNVKEFEDPAQVEHHLCRSPKRSSITKPWMASPIYSNVFSNHLNSVHNRGYDPSGQFNVSYEWLNEQYLAGYKIYLESMDFSRVQCGHEQISFEMIKI